MSHPLPESKRWTSFPHLIVVSFVWSNDLSIFNHVLERYTLWHFKLFWESVFVWKRVWYTHVFERNKCHQWKKRHNSVSIYGTFWLFQEYLITISKVNQAALIQSLWPAYISFDRLLYFLEVLRNAFDFFLKLAQYFHGYGTLSLSMS